MPTSKQLHFEYEDPRMVDGEPAAAAAVAVRQLALLLRLVGTAAKDAETMLRNATMTEGLEFKASTDPAAWWAKSWQRKSLETAMYEFECIEGWAKDIVKGQS